jgi:dTDP-4-dehydrorhamnose reductase
MRILVTGVNGQVARALKERGALHGDTILLAGRPELDLADPASVAAVIAASHPDLVVNAAAYTAVDRAEAEPEQAMRVNSDGAGDVARASAAIDAPIIHLSTDYVFDGASALPYREDHPTSPVSAYGRSKLAGEIAVAEGNPAHVILRTAWVYSPYGGNFVATMLRLSQTRDEIAVVADQFGAPTSALDIADGVLAVARRLRDQLDDESLRGVFHMTGAGAANWAEFAQAIFDEAAKHGRSPARARPITTAEYPTAAQRPANSRLDTDKLRRLYGIALPPWRDSLADCVARILSPQQE